MRLKPDKLFAAIFARKSGAEACAVLPNSRLKVAGYAGVERAVALVGYDVGP